MTGWRQLRATPGAVLIALVTVLYLGLVRYYVKNNALNADESFYAYAASQAMAGQLPYADFGYTQTPLLPYINGVVLEIGGYSLTALRMTGAGAGAVSLVALVWALRSRLGSLVPGGFAALALAGSPMWTSFQAVGKTYAVSGAALTLAAASIVVRGPFAPRLAALAGFGAISIGCRLTSLPVVALLCVVMAIRTADRGRKVLCLVAPALATLALHAPFVLRDWEAARFFIYEYHAAARVDDHAWLHLVSWFAHGAAAIVLLASGTALIRQPRRHRGLVPLLALTAWAAILSPLLYGGRYGEYVTPFLPLAAMAGMLAIWPPPRARSARSMVGRVLWLTPALSIAADLPFTQPREIPWLNRTARFIRENAPPGPILTPVPIVALKAGRPIIDGTAMGMFSTFPDGDEERAARFRSTTLARLTEAVIAEEPSALVLLDDPSPWNFGWQIPAIVPQPRQAKLTFMNEVRCKYDEVKRYGSYVLYLRKGPSSTPCPRDAPPDEDPEAPGDALPRRGGRSPQDL